MEPFESDASQLKVDEFTRRHLGELARWSVFLGIAGMSLCVLLIMTLLTAGEAFFQNMYKSNPALKDVQGSGKVMVFVMIAFLLMPFFMSFYLFRSGRRLRLGLLHERQDYLNNSLYNLKLVFRILGIFAIIYFSFVLMGVLGSLLGAA